jgi:G protein beta subunit-like protein
MGHTFNEQYTSEIDDRTHEHGSIGLTLSQVATLEGHTANVTALAYSAQGKWIVTGSEDGNVKVWDTRYVIV